MTGGETQLLFGVEFRMNTCKYMYISLTFVAIYNGCNRNNFFSIKSFKSNYISILYICQCQRLRFEIMQSIRLTEINKRNCSLLMKTKSIIKCYRPFMSRYRFFESFTIQSKFLLFHHTKYTFNIKSIYRTRRLGMVLRNHSKYIPAT